LATIERPGLGALIRKKTQATTGWERERGLKKKRGGERPFPILWGLIFGGDIKKKTIRDKKGA